MQRGPRAASGPGGGTAEIYTLVRSIKDRSRRVTAGQRPLLAQVDDTAKLRLLADAIPWASNRKGLRSLERPEARYLHQPTC